MSSCATLSVLSATTGEFRTWHRLSAWKHSEGQVRGSRHVSSTRRRVCFRFGGPSVGVVALTTLISTYVRLAIMRFTFSTPSSRTPRAWRSGSDPPPPGMDALRTCRGGAAAGGRRGRPSPPKNPRARAGDPRERPGASFPQPRATPSAARAHELRDRAIAPRGGAPLARARARARREPDRTRARLPRAPTRARDDARSPRARTREETKPRTPRARLWVAPTDAVCDARRAPFRARGA